MNPPAQRRPDMDATGAPSANRSVDETATFDEPGASTAVTGFGPAAAAGEVGTLGPYRVVKELGKGGMGAVYAAIDTRLDRRLALKVMLPRFAADPAARERFLREARAAARVKHDHVVTVYEADERNGVPYIAMEFLEGYPLDEYLKRKGNPSPAQAMRIAAEAAAGLAAAHRQGLVHRDVKPGNLWLEAPQGRVKVLDFGLARPVDAEVELTKSGAVVGTPAYMSPEQARGEKVDHRTDLYGLGAVLYRLVTGRLPFQAPNTMAMLIALGTEEPPPVRSLNPAVPEPLAALIHQLLAKAPAARPASADEVVKRLRGSMVAPPVAAAAPAPSQVVYVPIQVTAVPEANPFVDLDATEAEPAPAAAPAAGRRKPRPMWPVAAGLAALVLAAFGGVIIVIRNRDGSETKIEVPDGATVTVKGKDGKTLAQVGTGGKAPVADDSPDRKAAEYVLSVGGELRINGEGRDIRAAADLPKERFSLTQISLHGRGVTDAGLAHFKDCNRLQSLNLQSTGVTDAGLLHLKDNKGLRVLILTDTKVTDAGLAHLKDCTGLQGLGLTGTGVTDAGLANLKDRNGLTGLDLRQTRVTAKGLADFHAAVPGCRIDHDGGVIAAVDVDRKLAEWVIGRGGSVIVGGQNYGAGTKNPALPDGPVRLAGVKLKDAADLDGLGDGGRLTWLNLDSSGAADAALARVKGYRNLAFLGLNNTKVTDAGLAHLAGHPTLETVSLNGTGVTDTGLAHFRASAGLKGVNLWNTKVTDAGLPHLAAAKGLETLNLSGTAVTDAGLAHLAPHRHLLELRLHDTAVTDAGLARLHKCPSLTYLDVSKTKVTAKGLADFHAAVPGCRIEHDGGVIAAADTDRKAAEFVVSVGGVVRVDGQDRDLKTAEELPKERFALTQINLSGTKVTDAGLALVKDCRGLVYLGLQGTTVTDAGLAHVKDCNALRALDLRGTRVTDTGLAHVKDCRGLVYLDLQSTRVTDAGLAHFKDCKGLTHLDLQLTTVTDAGLAHFKDCNQLAYLYLTGTKVTDAGLAHFKDCKGLQVIVLRDTGVTDAGLAHFKGCSGLRGLSAQGTKVSAAGLARFHAAVPGCRIEHDGGVIDPRK